MTDSAPGPGWWLASDGNWYPPHLHPDVREPETNVDVGLDRRANDQADNQVQEATSFDPAWFDTPAAPTTEPPTFAELDADLALPRYVSNTETSPESVPVREIADSPVAASNADATGIIDWEAVAAERAARRAAVQKSPNGKRTAIAAIAAVLALGGIAAFAQNANDGDGGRTNEATTTISPSTTLADTTGPTGVDASGPTGVPGQISVFDLAPGACIDQSDLTEGLVTTVQEVPCDQPQTHEVYLTTSVVPGDVDYDVAAVTAYANQECTAGFDQYVGVAYNDSKYYFLHLAPSEESWTKEGDRDVVCLLLLDGEKLTSSVKGTAQ